MLMDLGQVGRSRAGITPEQERVRQEVVAADTTTRAERQAEFTSRNAVEECRKLLVRGPNPSGSVYTAASLHESFACMRANEANIRATQWGNTYYDKNVIDAPTDETLGQAFSRIPKVVLFGGAGLAVLIAYVKFFKS